MAVEQVTLQLKWKHAFQFAGYYVAKQQGYYQQAGLDVQIKEAEANTNVLDEVLAGKANFGVGTSSLLLARKTGKPVVVLAVIFQHSSYVLITPRHSEMQSIQDLSNKRIMADPLSAEIFAYLKREGIALDHLQRVQQSFKIDELLAGKVDAISAYMTNEPFLLDQVGFHYQIYSPRSAGIDFYGDNLFTSEAEIQQHPERVKAFRAASLRGWEHAMSHPDETIQLLLSKYPQHRLKEHYQYELTQMIALMRSDLITIGYMNASRWRHIADTYAEIGMLPTNFSLNGFLYDPNPKDDLTWLYTTLATVLALLGTVGAIALHIYRLNHRLALSLAEVKQTEQRLKVFSTAIEQSPMAVLITGPDNTIQYVNPKFTQETAYSSNEVLGQSSRILQADMLDDGIYKEMWDKLQQGELWSGELNIRRKTGEVYCEEAHIGPVKNSDGQITHYVAVLQDINERKQIHLQLAHAAHYDMLTGLPNRSLLFERINQWLLVAKRNHSQLALMFIDLDKFKPINDKYGHAVGDVILQEVAARMLACLRDSDSVGRVGGDEFIVLLPKINNHNDAYSVAEKIRIAINKPFIAGNNQLDISSCIGIAIYPQHAEELVDLIKNADLAMYQAKKSGGNRVSFFVAPS
ncbi:diguanylate cyclase [Iodobacter sp. CM08]|uniref:diguanylate cyclase domain-containing protein n=1 Tax=Iodobacter sp. CM08 TaxID=3085902 RepID=UPI0029816271|nr:diguanylate cyclase [Iodobacter sp. CM08]MDW5416024.1 diguanylate cyclase [Iodobacter sp. CM08]